VQEGMMIKINKTALPALGEMAIEQKWSSEVLAKVMETAKMPHYWQMDQENVISIHNGILCSHEEERNVIIRW
jgi:AMMECR1 domain-containing protein